MKIRSARPSDLAGVCALLDAAKLPLAGVPEHFHQFLVADAETSIVGCAGLECYGNAALLRSVAVTPQLRGTGLGRNLTEATIKLARELGVRRLVLLTETASDFFARFGFAAAARKSLPPELGKSEELRGACPETAVAMLLELDRLSSPLHVIVRDIQPGDHEVVARLYNHYIADTAITFEEEPVSGTEIGQRAAAIVECGLPWLVAEHDGDIAGYAYATPWRARPGYRFSVESTVYLKQEYFGRGIGSALYRALFERLRRKGIRAVIGGIALPNAASIALHERFGMEKVAHFREVGFKLGRWVDVGYWQTNL